MTIKYIKLIPLTIDAQWEEPYRPHSQDVSQCRECKIIGVGIYCGRNITESDDGASSSMPRRLKHSFLDIYEKYLIDIFFWMVGES